MTRKHAIVIGSSGMVGTQLINQLSLSNEFSQITSLVRRPTGITHPKLKEQIVDFESIEQYAHLIQGDVLFSTLGTTLANAKTKEAQYKVDFHYQYQVARLASANGIPTYVLVSSTGASSSSKNFYLRMKGELDDAVQQLSFKNITILRPGQLDGDRQEKRLGERIGLLFMHSINKLGLLTSYRPIQASIVAKAMLNGAKMSGTNIVALDKVFDLAEKE
jgi:uncharacterized protein YbjT (DUF2867 family)